MRRSALGSLANSLACGSLKQRSLSPERLAARASGSPAVLESARGTPRPAPPAAVVMSTSSKRFRCEPRGPHAKHGIRLLLEEGELFLSFDQFPWFAKGPVAAVLNVQRLSEDHLCWADLVPSRALFSEVRRVSLARALRQRGT